MVQNGTPCLIRLGGQKLGFRADDLVRRAGTAGSSNLTLLADLSVGSRARVSLIAGGDEISSRLLEMGLTPGVEVAVVGTALWGDPLELELRGYRLSVRRGGGEARDGRTVGRRTARSLS